jgi:peptide/nickel transport system substrate-binding protein
VLRVRYQGQLYEHPGLFTTADTLNTRVPPFNDVRVRRAFNYAVNRHRLVALEGGTDFNTVTCQILPPNVAGYSRYCPYTIHPSPNGKYTGPDLAKAKELVAASGTRGETVTFWGGKGFIDKQPAIPYLLSVLRELGYKTRLKVIQPPLFGARAGDSRYRWQALEASFGADYPTASGIILPGLTCQAFTPGTNSNVNYSEFCNHRIEREIARAQALQTTKPQEAAQLWAKVDHDITDQAPWVPYANPGTLELVSRRAGNYIFSPLVNGALLDQIWVR